MTEPERDALYARVLATPDGALLLDDLTHRQPRLVAEIRERIARMRARWRTGSAQEAST